MADAPKSTARRDRLVELQNTAQAKWDAVKAFEVDAPSGAWDGGKYMVTFPYPYMNGKLHLGHAFSLSKAEFSVGFQRLLGKKALFPFAFHCTGMPIQAAAFKLKKEYDLYGSPLPNFPCSPPEVLRMDAQAGEVIIGWKQPTCTGGKPFKGCKVLVRVGSAIDAPYQERGDAQIEPGEGSQWSATIGGLTAGEQVGFKVVSVVDGLPGVESKAVEKSPDGKHPLKLRDYDRDKDKDGASGAKGKGGGKPTGKPAAKIVAKTGGLNTQWDILASMGLTPEERVAFTDPVHWLKYFPPLGKQDMIAFGTGVDWRRSFITTDFNPYYDSFVRWQFYKLKEGDFIAFGKRPSLFSEVRARRATPAKAPPQLVHQTAPLRQPAPSPPPHPHPSPHTAPVAGARVWEAFLRGPRSPPRYSSAPTPRIPFAPTPPDEASALVVRAACCVLLRPTGSLAWTTIATLAKVWDRRNTPLSRSSSSRPCQRRWRHSRVGRSVRAPVPARSHVPASDASCREHLPTRLASRECARPCACEALLIARASPAVGRSTHSPPPCVRRPCAARLTSGRCQTASMDASRSPTVRSTSVPPAPRATWASRKFSGPTSTRRRRS